MSKWIDEEIKAYEASWKHHKFLRSPGDRWEVLEALKKAEEALKKTKEAMHESEECEFDDMAHYVIPMPYYCDAEEAVTEALAAIEDLGKE
jgi:hypothetical protein